jgi:hypothetical protein
MRKRLIAGLLTGVATSALTVGLVASPALAATWTVKPGGSVTGKTGTTTLTDKSTGAKLTCTTVGTTPASKAVGSLKSGSGLSNPIGSLTSVTFSNCTGPGGLAFTVKTSASSTNKWPITATSFSSGKTTGNISHIHATLTGTTISCKATIDGTGASANNGKVTITHTNSAANKLKVPGGGNLHAYNVSGCAGLINSGDAASFVATYTLNKGQTITSP